MDTCYDERNIKRDIGKLLAKRQVECLGNGYNLMANYHILLVKLSAISGLFPGLY